MNWNVWRNYRFPKILVWILKINHHLWASLKDGIFFYFKFVKKYFSASNKFELFFFIKIECLTYFNYALKNPTKHLAWDGTSLLKRSLIRACRNRSQTWVLNLKRFRICLSQKMYVNAHFAYTERRGPITNGSSNPWFILGISVPRLNFF